MASVGSLNTVQDLYIAYYQRPGDPSGLLYWADRLDTGTDLSTLEAAFGSSPEAQALYGPINDATIGTVIDSIYQALFNRLPDAAGKAFYTAGFIAGTFTPASIAYNILVGATGNDAVAVNNKEIDADRFSESVDGRPLSDPNFGQGSSFAATYAGDADAVAARTWLHAVTADPLTIQSESQTVAFIQASIANPGDPILGVSSGVTFSLTPSVDNILGTAGDDLILGVFGLGGGTDTYTVADNINGGGGKDTLSLTSQGTTPSPTTVTVTNVEVVSIRDLVGSTFDATLVSNNPAINFTDTVAGLTSKVTNGALASNYGLAGKGNLTVGLAGTSGAADTANVTLSGAGTSTSARSTVDVSNGGTVEGVALTASGTNFATLNTGGATKLTITGAGTNDLVIGSIAAVSTIDASATTGTNTFRVGTALSTGDTIKGGTGADTVNANFTAAALANPTMSGVETLALDFDAAGTLNLSKTTGATTVSLSGSTADATLTNADASLTKLTVLNQGAAHEVSLSHATGVTAPLTMQIGGATGTAATAITLNQVTLKGTTSLTLNEVGTKVNAIDGLTFNHDQSVVNVNVADNGTLFLRPVNAQGHDINALNITVGDGSVFSGTFQMSGGDLGDVNFISHGSGLAHFSTSSGGGNIGDVSVSALGTGAYAYAWITASGGDVGNLDLTVNGTNASGHISALVSGGSVGDINVSIEGTNAFGHMQISANSFDGTSAPTEDDGTGNIGNITIDVNGTNAVFSGSFQASGGDIGDVSVTMTGVNVSGSIDVYAVYTSGDTDNDTFADDWVHGGSVGDVTVDINGVAAQVNVSVTASGGNVGDVSYSLQGAGASGWLDVNARGFGTGSIGSGSPGGSIGSIDITLGDNLNFSGSISFTDHTGAISILAGDQVSGRWGMSGGGGGGAQLGDFTLNQGDNGGFTVRTDFLSGSTGSYDITLGDNAYFDAQFGWISGSVGPVTVTAGDGADVVVQSVNNLGTVNAVTLIGGEGGSGFVQFDDNTDLFAGVDASAWLGDLDVDLTGVQTGSVVTAGVGGSTITATGFADNVFGGAAADTIDAGAGDDLVTGGAGNDSITGGAGIDTLQGDAGNDTFKVAVIADFASGEVVVGGAGTDVLQFSVAGAITYVGRTVSGVETLDLTPGAGNAVVVTQSTGLNKVMDLGVVGATLTLNQATTAFDAAAQANAAAVNVVGEWYYNGTGASDGVLTYFDQTGGAAVAVTLVGVETGALTGGVASVGGNLVFTQA